MGWTWLLGNVGLKRKLGHEYFRGHTRMEMAFSQKVHNNFIKELQQLKNRINYQIGIIKELIKAIKNGILVYFPMITDGTVSKSKQHTSQLGQNTHNTRISPLAPFLAKKSPTFFPLFNRQLQLLTNYAEKRFFTYESAAIFLPLNLLPKPIGAIQSTGFWT